MPTRLQTVEEYVAIKDPMDLIHSMRNSMYDDFKDVISACLESDTGESILVCKMVAIARRYTKRWDEVAIIRNDIKTDGFRLLIKHEMEKCGKENGADAMTRAFQYL